jgi:hypothetical protein
MVFFSRRLKKTENGKRLSRRRREKTILSDERDRAMKFKCFIGETLTFD